MDKKTPTKLISSSEGNFSPINLKKSPAASFSGRNLTGSARVAKDIIADVYNAIQHWNDYHIRGAKIVKEIASFRKSSPKVFSKELENLTTDLYNVVSDLSKCLQQLQVASSQINSLGRLEKDTVLFSSLTVEKMSTLVEDIHKDYIKELEIKKLVLENIAHRGNIAEVMFFAALWTHQQNISNSNNLKVELLVTETGHKKIV